MSVPISNDNTVNQALVSALTRVRNNVDHGSTYQLEIEKIVRIGRALQYRGTPNDDEEAALLVAQLDNIRRLESGTETDSTPSPPPTNIAFPTPTCYVTVGTFTRRGLSRLPRHWEVGSLGSVVQGQSPRRTLTVTDERWLTA